MRSMNLNRSGSAKRTHHVEIDLGESNLIHEVGDSLGVYPTNCPELVSELIAVLGTSGEEAVVNSGATVTLRETLLRHRCLATPTGDLLELLARQAVDSEEAETLRALMRNDEPIEGWDVLDILLRFRSARPSPPEFIATLADLRPRLYSISNSPKRYPGQVHLTVCRVTSEVRGRVRKGVASTMIADRLAPGDEVRVFVQKSHGFTIPADPAASLIMIGPGTGVAPFRAFLQERSAVGASGKNWLFFGDQRRSTDFLYENELREFLEQGLLTRLSTAFSRDHEHKVYVQHRMIEGARDLFRWLDEGAFLYVCGDARRMAIDVDRTLHEIVREQGRMNHEEAQVYVSRLASAGRYCRDVY
jgi:sulfite reductase (NADPH) flavoprotein alpha-component